MNVSRCLTAVVVMLAGAAPAAAQYSTIENRFSSLNDSFYERMGVGFGFNINGSLPGGGGSGVVGIGPGGQPNPNGAIQFGQGGFNTAIPPFGGFNANAGGQGGFAIRGGPGTAFFNFDFAQGSNRTNVTQSPVVTVPNGVTGFVSDATMRPFVISLIPVVGSGGYGYVNPYGQPLGYSGGFGGQLPGGGPSTVQRFLGSGGGAGLGGNGGAPVEPEVRRPRRPVDPVDRKIAAAQSSTAGRPAASVASIRRQHSDADAELQRQALSYLQRGNKAESAGELGLARLYYRNALKTATGPLRQQVQRRLDAVSK